MAILTSLCWLIATLPVAPVKHKGANHLYTHYLIQRSQAREHLYHLQVLSEIPGWFLLPMLPPYLHGGQANWHRQITIFSYQSHQLLKWHLNKDTFNKEQSKTTNKQTGKQTMENWSQKLLQYFFYGTSLWNIHSRLFY